MLIQNPGLYVNGSWIPADTQATFDSKNPATDKVIGIVPEATPQQIDDAVQAAHKALAAWGTMPGTERAQYLLSAAKQFEESQSEVLDLLIAETGSSYAKVRFVTSKVGLFYFWFNLTTS